MSEAHQGPGWWQGSDGRWYPPETYSGSPSSIRPGTEARGQANPARTNRRHGQELLLLTTSRHFLVLAAIAAALLAIGYGLFTIGWIVFQASSVSTTKDLGTAGAWVVFVGFFVVLLALLSRVWKVLGTNQLSELGELGSVGLAALLMTIGSLLDATEAPSPSGAGRIVFAIGVTFWGIIAIGIAAASKLQENQSTLRTHPQGVPRHSPYWLGAGGAVILLAVAVGFPAPTFPDGTPGIVSGSIGAVGFMVFLSVLAVARSRHLIRSSALLVLFGALGALVLEQIARAVAYSLIFSTRAGITTFFTTVRVTEAVKDGIGFLAYLLLAAVAWRRLDEVALGLPSPAGSPQVPAGYPETTSRAPSASPPSAGTGSFAATAVPGKHSDPHVTRVGEAHTVMGDATGRKAIRSRRPRVTGPRLYGVAGASLLVVALVVGLLLGLPGPSHASRRIPLDDSLVNYTSMQAGTTTCATTSTRFPLVVVHFNTTQAKDQRENRVQGCDNGSLTTYDNLSRARDGTTVYRVSTHERTGCFSPFWTTQSPAKTNPTDWWQEYQLPPEPNAPPRANVYWFSAILLRPKDPSAPDFVVSPVEKLNGDGVTGALEITLGNFNKDLAEKKGDCATGNLGFAGLTDIKQIGSWSAPSGLATTTSPTTTPVPSTTIPVTTTSPPNSTYSLGPVTCGTDPTFGFPIATGTITNTSQQILSYTVNVSFNSSDGTQLVSGFANIWSVSPGQTANFTAQANTVQPVPGVTSCPVVGVFTFPG